MAIFTGFCKDPFFISLYQFCCNVRWKVGVTASSVFQQSVIVSLSLAAGLTFDFLKIAHDFNVMSMEEVGAVSPGEDNVVHTEYGSLSEGLVELLSGV